MWLSKKGYAQAPGASTDWRPTRRQVLEGLPERQPTLGQITVGVERRSSSPKVVAWKPTARPTGNRQRSEDRGQCRVGLVIFPPRRGSLVIDERCNVTVGGRFDRPPSNVVLIGGAPHSDAMCL
jgi:hypothetical protein